MNNNDKWIIGIDLDGTLLRGPKFDENKKVTDLTRRVFEEMHKLGHVVCIDTGRGYHGTTGVYESIGLPSPIINYAGAHIHNPKDENFKPIITSLDKDSLKHVLYNNKFSNRIIGTSIDTPFVSYFESETLEPLKEKLIESGARTYSEDKLDIDQEIITAANIIYETDEKEIWDIISELEEEYKEHFHVVDWISKSAAEYKAYGIEINSAAMGKGVALIELAKRLGIPESNTMGIGDSPNDRDLMKTPAVGVAMKNARPEIKELADIVIDWTNEEEGVAKFLIEKFNLNIKY